MQVALGSKEKGVIEILQRRQMIAVLRVRG
jgi:hypothetical protein